MAEQKSCQYIKRTYLAQRSTARGFIRNKATLEDLEELKKLIEDREKLVINLGNNIKKNKI
ncbi:hypothetical protein CUN46_10340 [Enterococcus faecium]|nr:hypothetical protein [Enterococcus faecium]PQC59982.1 hypothetical protein CUN46_10340 [Enterococcus faecium]